MADNGLIDGGYAFITRGTETFKVSSRVILADVHAFMCRKCNHIWLPKDRDFAVVPLHCPKCYDKYWFASHNELIRMRQKEGLEVKPLSKEKGVW